MTTMAPRGLGQWASGSAELHQAIPAALSVIIESGLRRAPNPFPAVVAHCPLPRPSPGRLLGDGLVAGRPKNIRVFPPPSRGKSLTRTPGRSLPARLREEVFSNRVRRPLGVADEVIGRGESAPPSISAAQPSVGNAPRPSTRWRLPLPVLPLVPW